MSILNYTHVKFYSLSSHQILQKILSNMPKEPKHIAEAQKQRRKIKEKLSKYVPGKVTLQVLGTGAKGAPRALYMFSDQSRYLFNCGEGTQRLAHEHKMKLSRIEHIFVTQPVWKNIGGLPGIALTIQDVGVPEITLHGPKGLDEIFVATKRFVVIRDLKIKMAQCDEENVFEDSVMTVRYVPIYRQSHTNCESIQIENEDCPGKKDSGVEAVVNQLDASTSTKTSRRSRRNSITRDSITEDLEDDIDYYAHEQSGKRAVQNLKSKNSEQVLKDMKEKSVSMVFVCKLQPRPGALNLSKCVEMGVPPGPLLGKIKGGEDITLPNGKTVSSKDVCEPDDPGPLFIVVDCVTCNYMDSLINNPTLKKHQKFATTEEDKACLVVHFTPKDVVNDPRYRKWMDDFPATTQHLMLNEMNTCMGSESVHRTQYKLNLLSEDIFPLLGEKGTQVIEEGSEIHINKKQKCNDNAGEHSLTNGSFPNLEGLSVQSRPQSPTQPYLVSNTFCNYYLRPHKGLDRSSELKLNIKEYINETMVIENFQNLLKQIKCDISEKRKQLTIKEYPQILFLGTGSCIPNKTRNTSGILVKISDSQNILLDCGEGTYGQIVRFFGDTADQELAKLGAIYISHLHADHHIGLIGVLQGRRRALESLNLNYSSVQLFAPKQIFAWLLFYDSFFENICEEFNLIPNSDFLYDNTDPPKLNDNVLNLGIKDLKTCYVKHCPNAFGVCLTDTNGLRLTYSGDTMPCDNLIEIGKDCDVLIHEATMEDELAHEAIIKMHSTTSQAIEIGKSMNAKNILLTHFSQRYAKLPRFNDNFSNNIGIAFDNMQVRVGELPLVPLLYPAFKQIFAEHCEELEHKAVKRQLKIERERSLSQNRQDQKQKVVS